MEKQNTTTAFKSALNAVEKYGRDKLERLQAGGLLTARKQSELIDKIISVNSLYKIGLITFDEAAKIIAGV